MEIVLAKNIGFCFGVRSAYQKSLKVLQDNKKSCQMLGQLVHNKAVVDELKQKGLKFISSVDEAEKGVVIIRAHGASKEVFDTLREKGIRIIDATCPLVKKVQDMAKKMQEEGREIIIIGDKGHIEVESIQGHLGNSAIIAESENDLARIIEKLPKERPIGVVAQTTQDMEKVEKCVKILEEKFKDMRYENTLCPAVLTRQREVRELSEKVDLLLVIGAKNSANTQRLVEIAKEKNEKVFNVEDKEQLCREWFQGKGKIGIASGTSAPDWIIEQIVEEVKSFDL